MTGKSKAIPVSEASAIILSQGSMMPSEVASSRAGGIVANTVLADRPHPPFDRVAMDGIAIRFADMGQILFTEEGFAPAGAPAAMLGQAQGSCLRVATGAVLPIGADTVIPVEHLRSAGERRWAVERAPVPGANVHRKAADLAQGTPVLTKGMRLGPCEAGAAATFGEFPSVVARLPRIALVCTGDEIVPPSQTPPPHGIRASHPACLGTALALAGFPVSYEALVSDAPGDLVNRLRGLTEYDLILCTGGVSVGERDLVPDALEAAGFRKVFHGVQMKPGKPLWFGVAEDGRTAFGLPGNPVSALVSLVRFVLPHLRYRSGDRLPDPFLRFATEPLAPDPFRTRFLPCVLVDQPAGTRVQLVKSGGSGDLPALVGTDGFVEVPPGDVPAALAFRRWG
ncbi:MAG: molybdopterin molybdotransferase MoeA [Fibrobacterota bacterium]|nr:molybdopterin molybdotransferase MoeA [Fibrobacterota bacterium]QQS04863.1 MAG: molybdopterin molybdotransferase MoeA [Fibrobacterota bacterium]